MLKFRSGVRQNYDVHLGVDDVIYISVSGRITNAHLEEFVEWSEQVKPMIEALAKRGKSPIRICADAGGVAYFETKPVMVLRDLMSYDKKYALRTAIVGANTMTRMLVDAVISLTGRTNVMQFKEKKDALLWLLDTPHPS